MCSSDLPRSKAAVAFLPDAAFIADNLTAERAVAYYARFFADFDADKARDLIRFFKLPADRTIKEMSRGMGEKLRIALTMSRRARVYLFDEPISGVDPAAREVLMNGILTDFNLPDKFKIDTPLGSYNPDWAYVEEAEGRERVYFVMETKGKARGTNRPSEEAKIDCAEKHFEALQLGDDFHYDVETEYHLRVRV